MSDAKAQIGFHQIGLGGVLKQYRLQVPSNQREYSWTLTEVTTLLQDFAKAIADGEGEYFLGTIVTIPRSPELLEVVDGQQRLATTAILLSQIRNYLIQREPLLAESITNGFLTDIDRERRERVAKLQLNLDDNEFFRSMIELPGDNPPTPTKASHQLINDAFNVAMKQVRNIVAGLDEKDHGDVLNKWVTFVEHSAQVILLKVPSDVNAYKMFETLNDRGLKTSQSDLVKNYLFGQSGNRLSEAQQKWTLMRGALESLDGDDINTVTFLRHALVILKGYLRESEVYERVQEAAKGSQASIIFMNSLNNLAINYVATFNPEHEKWNGYPDAIRRAIKTLNLLNNKPMRPLNLAVAAKFSEKEAAEAYQKFISWEVRFLIAGATRNTAYTETPIAVAAKKVFDGEITDVNSLTKALIDVIPNDEQFQLAFESVTVSKASLARYYLRSLEMTAKQEAAPWFIPNDDRETINLEHVLPIEPQGNWNSFDPVIARADVRRLGNLALLLAKHNCDLRSADFLTKREVYKTTPYVLTSQIATVADWNHDRIVERQKTLAVLAVKTWPL